MRCNVIPESFNIHLPYLYRKKRALNVVHMLEMFNFRYGNLFINLNNWL